MAENIREARRRKIVEQGSDRLGLITGRIKSIPSSSSLLSPRNRYLDSSSQPMISHDQDSRPPVIDQTIAPDDENKKFDSVLPKHNSISDASQSTASYYETGPETPSHKTDIGIEAQQSSTSKAIEKCKSTPNSSEPQHSRITTLDGEEHQHHMLSSQTRQFSTFFNPNQIGSAISATESTRLQCSITITILVILSYVGFPLPSSNIIKNILTFRPLYLLLLTNLTVVIARVLSDKQHFGMAVRGENRSPWVEGKDWAEQITKAIKAGFMLQKAMNAVFMDCSVYSVIVVMSLSFLQLLNSRCQFTML